MMFTKLSSNAFRATTPLGKINDEKCINHWLQEMFPLVKKIQLLYHYFASKSRKDY